MRHEFLDLGRAGVPGGRSQARAGKPAKAGKVSTARPAAPKRAAKPASIKPAAAKPAPKTKSASAKGGRSAAPARAPARKPAKPARPAAAKPAARAPAPKSAPPKAARSAPTPSPAAPRPAAAAKATAAIGPIDRLHQVALVATDLAAAIGFYRDVLGLRFIARFDPPGLAFFDLGGGARLMLSATASAATLYFHVKDVDAAVKALSGRGVHFLHKPSLIHRDDEGHFGKKGLGEWMAFFKDPSENVLAIVERR